MKSAMIRIILGAATFGAVATASLPQPAAADTTSTALIAGAAALIAGSLIYDSSRHQYYYVRSGHRTYVDNNTANYYRQHGGRYQGPDHNWHGSRYHDDRHGH